MNTLEKQAVLNKLASVQKAICYVLRQRLMQKQAAGWFGWGSKSSPAAGGAPPVAFRDALWGLNPYGDAQEKARQAHSKAQGYDKFEPAHWRFGGTVESKVPQVSFWNALWGRNPYGDAQEKARQAHSKARGYDRFTGPHNFYDASLTDPKEKYQNSEDNRDWNSVMLTNAAQDNFGDLPPEYVKGQDGQTRMAQDHVDWLVSQKPMIKEVLNSPRMQNGVRTPNRWERFMQ